MNKVFVLAPGEDWIVDRFVKEWNEDNADISVHNPHAADVIWLLADWCWRQVPSTLLSSRKVITTVHHITPQKFGINEITDFLQRDGFTDVYHVYNQVAYDFVKQYTQKPIKLIKYWANQKIWKKTHDKFELREKYRLPLEKYIIGSFQRDTEGRDLMSPKLEKGPDLLCDYLEKMSNKKDIHVLLAGWRRQYVISRLQTANIQYTYVERPLQHVVNELYQTLDLYPITARCEGGPQALIECGLLDVPVVSRCVGIADQILQDSSIADDVYDAVPSIPNIDEWKLPQGYSAYRNLIASIVV